MWKIKAEYAGKVLHIRGYGVLDFNKENANTIHKLSLLPKWNKLVKFIEKVESVKSTTTKEAK